MPKRQECLDCRHRLGISPGTVDCALEPKPVKTDGRHCAAQELTVEGWEREGMKPSHTAISETELEQVRTDFRAAKQLKTKTP